MNFDPGLNELELGFAEVPFEQFSIWNGNDGFVILIFDMDMGTMVFLIIEVVHQNDDAIEHGDNGHDFKSLLGDRQAD